MEERLGDDWSAKKKTKAPENGAYRAARCDTGAQKPNACFATMHGDERAS